MQRMIEQADHAQHIHGEQKKSRRIRKSSNTISL